jgi:hypothetical protein
MYPQFRLCYDETEFIPPFSSRDTLMKRVCVVVCSLILLFFPSQAQDGILFVAEGQLSYGGGSWRAEGLINSLRFYPGDTLELLMNITMTLPDGDVSLPYNMGAVVLAKQVFAGNGQQLPYLSDEAWSPFTVHELPLTNVQVPATPLQSSTTTDLLADPEAQTLTFALAYSTEIPDLEDGMYVLQLAGFASIEDSDIFGWYLNRIFSTTGTGSETFDPRLPIIIQVGDVQNLNVEWAWQNSPASDSIARIVSAQPVVLPQDTYSLVPSLLSTPFTLNTTGNTLRATVRYYGTTAPETAFVATDSGEVLEITTLTPEVDENGNVSLEPFDSAYQAYNFNEYGFYDVILDGDMLDILGNRYTAGGTYRVVIAEPFSLVPSILAGQPLTLGEHPFSVQLLTELTEASGLLEVQLEPLQGETQINSYTLDFEGTQLQLNEPLTFDREGIYTLTYTLTGTDAQGDFYYTQVRGVGVVSNGEGQWVLRGRRGIQDYNRHPQAWFDTAVFPVDTILPTAYVNTPFFSGDIATIPNREAYALRPAYTLQDTGTDYLAYLQSTYPNLVTADGDLTALAREDSLPLLYPDGYVISTVTRWNGQVLSQFAQGNPDGGYVPLVSFVGADEGDVLFSFGGALISRPSTAVAGYASVVLVSDAQSARVEPNPADASDWSALVQEWQAQAIPR